MTYKKKLIEVAIPLEAINKESAREKSIRHGHPSTIHLWWARRPLAACRAVLFAQLVDDPSAHPDKFPTEKEQGKERKRLFKIIEELVKWENINNERVLKKAKEEILKSCDGDLPSIYDPFCGGGSIPLEAQRLGLEAYGSDLNPVAVMISKALTEIPSKFIGLSPVNPTFRSKSLTEQLLSDWSGAKGLAEDIKYYGEWIKSEAFKQIGNKYPQIKLPKEYGDKYTNVIAWIWARTIPSPDPVLNGACIPLVGSFELCVSKEKTIFVEPVIDLKNKQYHFEIKSGEHNIPEGTINRNGAICIISKSKTPISLEYIRSEARAGRMSTRLMAIVAEGSNGRVYLPPTKDMEMLAKAITPVNHLETCLPEKALGFRVQAYGFTKHEELFTPRQLLALKTFSDLIQKARDKILEDAIKAGMRNDGIGLNKKGAGANAYADAIAVYLSFAVDKAADYWSSFCTWSKTRETIRNTFSRHALPMVWDFAECNPFSDSTGNFSSCLAWVYKTIENTPKLNNGCIFQRDAQSEFEPNLFNAPVISTDPPYFDNIGYADLSDFFYVWMRSSIKDIFPEIFSTLLTPKDNELIASPFRKGSKEKAEQFFLNGITRVFKNATSIANNNYPLTIFYAFKQTESKEEGVSSTGWETFLEGIIKCGLSISATWPLRTELSNRVLANNTNALASSILLVCKKPTKSKLIATRNDFIKTLKKELPNALKNLKESNIAPVDLTQASIGPGIEIFTRFNKVLEADGSEMSIRCALQLINKILDDYLSEEEAEYDADTRFAITWFEQYSVESGAYGDAETIAKARNISVDGVVEAGIIESKSGKVKLIKRERLPIDWDPDKDKRLTIWEATQYLIRELQHNGESGAASLLYKLGSKKGELARDLAYRLYGVCERKKWTEEALAYNSLAVAWPNIVQLSNKSQGSEQIKLGV